MGREGDRRMADGVGATTTELAYTDSQTEMVI